MPLLPSELNYLIVELCSESPSSLAALARTHTSFQREAEKALYDTLSIGPLSDDSLDLKCMETLSKNPEKAALVRSLTIEYESDYYHTYRTWKFLSKYLINMHSLSDLHVMLDPIQIHGQLIEDLVKILWSVCKMFIFSKLIILLGDTVEVIFDYKLTTAITLTAFLESLRVKPNCKYLG